MRTIHIPRTKREAVAKIRAASLDQLLDWRQLVEGGTPTDPKLKRRGAAWITRCAGEIKREIDRRYQAGSSTPP